MDYFEEEPRHRKKHSQKSKSSRRADHKHDYERVILQAFIGWCWGGRCRICGRIDSKEILGSQEFVRPECLRKPSRGNHDFWTAIELLHLFPNTPIYVYDSWPDYKEYAPVKEVVEREE